MWTRCLRVYRSHPVLVAAIIGAVLGFANVVRIEMGAVAHNTSDGVLLLLWSSSSSHSSQANPLQTATLLLIEVAGNVFAFALLFAVPVALLVAIRRIFFAPRRSAGDSPSGPADSPDRP